MSRIRVTVRGETYVTLNGVAECYECDIAWVREIYGQGLLGSGVVVEGEPAIPARLLDRVAEIRRAHVHLGLDLLAIAALLGFDVD